MGRIEDLKETAPCGMEIHYTVDENDMIAYNDINGRGVFCDKCEGCTWRGICKPERQAKTMSRQTYVEIYNLIDEVANKAMEEVVLSGKLNDVPSGRLFRADLGFLQMCQSL